MRLKDPELAQLLVSPLYVAEISTFPGDVLVKFTEQPPLESVQVEVPQVH